MGETSARPQDHRRRHRNPPPRAARFRARRAPETRNRLAPPLNFVIIGGGPTGVELAGAISDIAKLYMKRDFRHIDPSMAKVLILEGSPHILGVVSRRPAEEGRRATQRARRRGRAPARTSLTSSPATSWSATSASKASARSGPPVCRPRRSARCSLAARHAADATAAAASSSTSTSTLPATRKSSSAAISRTSSRTATRSPASHSPPCRWATTPPSASACW